MLRTVREPTSARHLDRSRERSVVGVFGGCGGVAVWRFDGPAPHALSLARASRAERSSRRPAMTWLFICVHRSVLINSSARMTAAALLRADTFRVLVASRESHTLPPGRGFERGGGVVESSRR